LLGRARRDTKIRFFSFLRLDAASGCYYSCRSRRNGNEIGRDKERDSAEENMAFGVAKHNALSEDALSRYAASLHFDARSA